VGSAGGLCAKTYPVRVDGTEVAVCIDDHDATPTAATRARMCSGHLV